MTDSILIFSKHSKTSSLLDPIATPIHPFSKYLWLAVILTYFASVAFYKLLRFWQSFEERNFNNEVSEETISEVFLHILGIFVLQSVKMKYVLADASTRRVSRPENLIKTNF